jgi:hypothetical protein
MEFAKNLICYSYIYKLLYLDLSFIVLVVPKIEAADPCNLNFL